MNTLKLTEHSYSYLHDVLSHHANPWTDQGKGYHDPARIKREWRKEVKLWITALETITPLDI